jgi:hypothetical protein
MVGAMPRLVTAAVIALGVAFVPASAGAARTCTSSDLEGTRAPAMLRDHGLDTQDGPLVAGTRYRVVVVQELAIGDNSHPVDGTIAVSAPNGPALTPGTEDDRPVYDFTPAGAGTVRLVVSWDAEVGSSGSGDVCSASQSFDIPVLAPTIPKIRGSFHRGGSAFGSSFLLKLAGQKPQDPGKVTVVLRARRGTTRPPRPRGHALGRFSFKPLGDGHFEAHGGDRQLRHAFYATTTGSGVKIYGYPNMPFGRTLRFAFSLQVIQNGKTVGGMRSGARCQRVQFTGHSAIMCRAVRLVQRP